MKKGTIGVCGAILCLILSATSGIAQETPKAFTLKLGGGTGSLSGGDLTSFKNGANELLRDIAGLAGGAMSGALENAKWGLELEGELVYNISGHLGIGLGTGYIRASADSLAEMRAGTLGRIAFGWMPVFTVVPVTLSGHYRFPVAPRLNVFARAGIGYYFATLDYKTLEESEIYGLTLREENDGTARKGGWGLQGGLGLEVRVSGRLALYLEGGGRYVTLTDWDVDNSYRDSYGSVKQKGTFWYVEKKNEDTGKSYPGLEMRDKEPSDPAFLTVRKAKFSLSGIVFKTGVKFGF
jgi:hypothetical protein